jgi:hypothetical protein
MLKAKSVPAKFWGEAAATAVFVLNRSLTRSLEGKTPFEAWYGRKPNMFALTISQVRVRMFLNADTPAYIHYSYPLYAHDNHQS